MTENINENLLDGTYELENFVRQIFKLVFFLTSISFFLDISLSRSFHLSIRSGLQDKRCMIEKSFKTIISSFKIRLLKNKFNLIKVNL